MIVVDKHKNEQPSVEPVVPGMLACPAHRQHFETWKRAKEAVRAKVSAYVIGQGKRGRPTIDPRLRELGLTEGLTRVLEERSTKPEESLGRHGRSLADQLQLQAYLCPKIYFL